MSLLALSDCGVNVGCHVDKRDTCQDEGREEASHVLERETALVNGYEDQQEGPGELRCPPVSSLQRQIL